MADVDPIRRERKRRDSLSIKDQEIADRVLKFFKVDDDNRSFEKEARIQRYAKFRMWTEGPKDWPWPDACFSIDTEILTDTGWKYINAVEVGESVNSRSPLGWAE